MVNGQKRPERLSSCWCERSEHRTGSTIPIVEPATRAWTLDPVRGFAAAGCQPLGTHWLPGARPFTIHHSPFTLLGSSVHALSQFSHHPPQMQIRISEEAHPEIVIGHRGHEMRGID